MKVIGITGGVGAGKSEVMNFIAENSRSCILKADEAAHEIEKKGQDCYRELVELLSEDILGPDGEIDKAAMAAKIFSDEGFREKVNGIIHPAVKAYILRRIEEEKNRGEADFFFIEAALLIEERYDLICDELWYIYADEDVRRKRLKISRGYSDEKIDNIIRSQCTDETFRKYCRVVIDNNGDIEDTGKQILEAISDNTGSLRADPEKTD